MEEGAWHFRTSAGEDFLKTNVLRNYVLFSLHKSVSHKSEKRKQMSKKSMTFFKYFSLKWIFISVNKMLWYAYVSQNFSEVRLIDLYCAKSIEILLLLVEKAKFVIFSWIFVTSRVCHCRLFK